MKYLIISILALIAIGIVRHLVFGPAKTIEDPKKDNDKYIAN